MSIKLAISYETDSELSRVIAVIAPLGMKIRMAEQKGRYKRAYATDTPRKRKLEKSHRMQYNASRESTVNSCFRDGTVPRT